MSSASRRLKGAKTSKRFAPEGSLLAAALALAAPVCFSDTGDLDGGRATQEELEAFRQSGDLAAQRRHGWRLLAQLVELSNGRPAFESWYGEGATFSPGDEPAAPGLGDFSRPRLERLKGLEADSGVAPILDLTLYNPPAFEHIRRHRLYQASELDRLLAAGKSDPAIAGNRTIPAFPRDAIVLKTAWWPIAREDVTPVPVWDPESNPVQPHGNAYTTWARVVAVDTRSSPHPSPIDTIAFAGRTFPVRSRAGLDSFYHVDVGETLAGRLNADRDALKIALLALGRPLRAGDALALIAVHLASHEVDDWVWVTAWWHDRPDEGPYATGRPATEEPLRSYLMQAALDEVMPLTPDGFPHICFNPWFEGRFPDGGQGGGTVSNCVACHRRASYPAVEFLPVTRGPADLVNDPAYADGRLRTSLLWSIPLRATP